MNNPMPVKHRLCRVATLMATLLPCALPISGQTHGEYFWNSDPGIGRATAMTQDGETDGYHGFTLDASSLSPGMNMLGLRIFNERGRWSQTRYSLVMVEANPAETIWSGEYFWNTDPGVGKATPLPMEGASTGSVVAEIPADALAVGANTLGVRINSGGVWSQTRTYLVAVPAAPTAAEWSAEYFWDNDPGIGHATPLDISSDASGASVDVELLAQDLAPGQHTIGFRTCSGRVWSPTVTSIITVKDDRKPEITAAEYFWGDDPGLGNGTPVDIKPGDSVTVESLEIDFPQAVADEYVLSFRARSAQGWGTTVTKVIPHLYVQSITLTPELQILPVGTSMRIDAEVTPADAFEDELVWTSSDTAVATVGSDGTVTGIAPGKATITATATDGTGTAGEIEITVLVPVTSISLSSSELTLEVSRSATLKADVLPADATDKSVAWSIEGDRCVSVSEEGVVTATAVGEAVITATANGSNGVKSECRVKVIPLRGDADGSGSLAVNDVVLTARGVVGDMDSKLVFEAVDMNSDGTLTVGDLTKVVAAVLNYTAPAMAFAPAAEGIEDHSLAPELDTDGMCVTVMTDGFTRFCGLQFDVAVSDGLKVGRISLADGVSDGHSVALAGHDGFVRAVSYGSTPYLAGNDGTLALITLEAEAGVRAGEYDVTLTNVMASDADGNLYRLANRHITVAYSPTTGLHRMAGDGLAISVEGHTVTITSASDTVITFSDMRGISRRIEINAGVNVMTVDTEGIYVIEGRKIVIQ